MKGNERRKKRRGIIAISGAYVVFPLSFFRPLRNRTSLRAEKNTYTCLNVARLNGLLQNVIYVIYGIDMGYTIHFLQWNHIRSSFSLICIYESLTITGIVSYREKDYYFVCFFFFLLSNIWNRSLKERSSVKRNYKLPDNFTSKRGKTSINQERPAGWIIICDDHVSVCGAPSCRG